MRSRQWLWVAILAGVGNARAVPTDFPAGSMVIPMDLCWQNATRINAGVTMFPALCPVTAGVKTNLEQGGNARSGITRAFGLVWRLLQAGVPVNVVIQPGKTGQVGGIDLGVGGLNPVAYNLLHPQGGAISQVPINTGLIYYTGAPFIIDARYRAQVEAVLRADWASQSNFSPLATARAGDTSVANVIIHVLSAAKTGIQVAQTLTGAGKMAVLDLSDDPSAGNPDRFGHGYGYTHIEQLMCNVGFKEVSGSCGSYMSGGMSDLGTSDSTYPDTTGTVFHRINRVSDFRNGVLISGGYKFLYVPHWIGWSGDGTASAAPTSDQRDVYRAISAFLDAGGSVVMNGKSIEGMEQTFGNSGGTGITTKGYDPSVMTMTQGGLFRNNPSSLTFYGRWLMSIAYTSLDWTIPDQASPFVQIGDLGYRQDNGGIYNFKATTSGYLPGVRRLVTMTSYDMDVLAARYKDDDSTKGMLVYSTANRFNYCLAGQRLMMNTIMTLNNVPALPPPIELARTSPVVHDGYVYQGSYVQSGPASTVYPLVKGHFRKYALSDLSSANVTAFGAANATWDAAALLPASRTIYTKNPSSSVLISFDTSNLTALQPVMNVGNSAATTTAINGIRAGGLGGIDHSTPAIVGTSKLVPNGNTRPVIALVGSLDGMLHAFRVSDGTELWAYIPSSQIGRIGNYKAAVNGSPMVSDVFYGGSWHTLAVMTMGTMPEDELSVTAGHNYNDTTNGPRGTIEALDISDTALPTFAWVGVDSRSGFVMGQAQGAAHGLIFRQGGRQDIIYVATNNQNSGTPVPGVNLYALNVQTGSRIWSWNQSYNRLTNVPSGSTFGPVPNAVPAVPVVVNRGGDGSFDDRVYFGDLDGDVWELDARTGRSARLLWPAPPTVGTVPASPITQSLTLYRRNFSDSSGVHELRLAFTRGSADFMADSTPSYFTVIAPEDSLTGTVASRMDIAAGTNEHYLGRVNIFKGDAYFMVSEGTLSGAIAGSRNDTGKVRRINLDTQATLDQMVKKGGTEITVNADSSLIATSAAGITEISAAANNSVGSPINANGLKINYKSIKPMAVRAWFERK